MKKSIKIVILAIIFILSTALSVYAADAGTADVTLSPASISAKVGETVTITLSANCATGIEGIDSTLEYNKTKLKLTNEGTLAATGFTSMSGTDQSTGEFKLSVLSDAAEEQTSATFATLTFEVLDTANVDETLSIKLTGIEVGDSNYDWMTVEDKEVTLTVVNAEEQKPGDEEQKPGDEEQKPGDEEQNPGDEEQKPGDEEQNPGDEEQKPGDEEQNPGDEEQKPGDEEQNPGSEEENKKPDDTTAKKPINNAGLTNYAVIAVLGIGILAIVLYKKCIKYRDVK